MKHRLQTFFKYGHFWQIPLLALVLSIFSTQFVFSSGIKGSWNSWSGKDFGEGNVCFIYLDGSHDYYEFKIYDSNRDYGNSGKIEGSITNNWHFPGNNGSNCKIKTGNTGYYKFWHYGWKDGYDGKGYYEVNVNYPSGFNIKHNWNNSGWSWQSMTEVGSSSKFRYEGKYSGTNSLDLGFDDSNAKNRTDATLKGSPTSGDDCIFLVNAGNVGSTIGEASIIIGKKTYSITGTVNSLDWGTWASMTSAGDGTYYYDCTSVGKFKLSDMCEYDAYFYTSLSTNSSTGATLTFDDSGSFSGDKNCNVSASSGYTTPVRIYLNPSTNKVWAVATPACSAAPVIGTQPQNTEVCMSGTASLTIAATITVGTPTYTWYSCNSTGGSRSQVGTGSSFSIPTSSSGTFYYICVASGCGETTDSNVATVTVDATSVAGSISALANPICSGTGTTLSIPNGNTGSITQWQYYNTASSQWTNLETSSTQTTGNLTAATQYKAYVKNGVCDAVASSTYTVNLKTAPSKPLISGNTIMCGPSESGAYTYTSTDVSADSYSWTVTGATLYSGSGTSSITVTAGDVDDSPVTIAVTAVNCPNNTPLSTAADNFSARIFKSASAGTVNLTKNSVCVNESGITASRTGTWYSGGGNFQWSSSNTTYATVSNASAPSPTITAKKPTPSTVNITCAITSPTCGSTTNKSAALTINGPEAFTIGASPASPKPWEVVTLSTSTSASANWSITSNPSGKAYLNTTSGSSTKLKAPYDASANTVKASITSDGCTQEATESVSIGSEACN